MGGKTGTTTSSVAIPPEVLARYNDVNKQAQTTAGTPFQQYSTDPNAFVAPLNAEQQAATGQINQYANAAQPAISYAQQGYTPQGFQQGVAGYMNPFLSNAMGATAAQMQNVNKQEQQKLLGQGISQGAFGGDRSQIAQAELANQQNLAMGQTLGNMASQGFQNAAQNYQTGLGQIGALGIQGQQAGLQGAQAMMGAGTLGQQTSQAGNTALYNQFQQQQAYPFQVSQFLANIAEGTGALSGSTTTTTAPQSFFSDARLKEDIKRVGTAKNGLPIYTFKYKGDDTEQTHTGYMAQDVEKVHPEAVGESHGYKTVDYDKASEPVHRAFGGLNLNPAANLMTGGGDQTSQDPEWLKNHPAPEGHGGDNRGPAGFVTNHDYSPSSGYGGGVSGAIGNLGSAIGGMFGGITGDSGVGGTEGQGMYARGGSTNSEGGVVAPEHSREGYFDGGDVVNPNDLSALLAQQQQMYSPFEKGGLYGGSAAGTPGGKGVVPAANLHVSHLAVANPARTQQGETLMGDVQGAMNIGDTIKKANDYRKEIIGHPAVAAQAAVPANAKTGAAAQPAVAAQDATGYEWLKQYLPQGQAHGGVVGYASGGGVEPYQTDDPMSQIVSDTEKDKNRSLMTAKTPDQQGSSTLGDLSKIASIGSTAATIGSDIATVLPFFLKDGGVAGHRGHFADGGDTTPDDIMNKYAPAIANIESSGNYGALGPVTKGGDRAYGKYQVMGANVPTWTKEATGTQMTPEEFLANKEAQDTTFKHHFGKALEQYGTPEDAASVWFSGKPRAAAGNASDVLGTTVPSYLKKFNEQLGTADFPAKGASPAQATVSDQQGFQPPESEAPKKSLGDTLMSEQFLVPLLAGLGTMAGSNSRYLGSAILQGIGGGAKAYEDVQSNLMQRQLDQPIVQQRNIETMNKLTSGLAQYNAMNGSNLSLADYAKMVGYKGEIPSPASAITTNAAVPNAAAVYTYSPSEMQSMVVTRNGVQLPASSDPLYMKGYRDHWAASGDNPYAQKQVELANNALEQSREYTTDIHGNKVPTPGSVSTGQDVSYAGQQMDTSNDYSKKAIAFTDTARTVKQNLTDLENIYTQFKSGAEYPAKANFQRLMSAIDPNSNYPSLHNADASNYDSAIKSAMSLITNQLASMPAGAPKAELDRLASAIAMPNLDPAAVHHIISRGKAALDYQLKMFEDYDPKAERYNVHEYQKRFQKENPWDEFVQKTEQETKPSAGSQGNIIPEVNKIYVNAQGQKARWDGTKYVGVQ